MSLNIELTPDEEARLRRAAEARGLAADEYARELIRAGEWNDEPWNAPEEPRPRNGAELVAYWDRLGVFGSRPDIADALEHARSIRRKAERRERG